MIRQRKYVIHIMIFTVFTAVLPMYPINTAEHIIITHFYVSVQNVTCVMYLQAPVSTQRIYSTSLSGTQPCRAQQNTSSSPTFAHLPRCLCMRGRAGTSAPWTSVSTARRGMTTSGVWASVTAASCRSLLGKTG